jgi:methyl-accepting chemotaxis protein
MKEQRSTIMIKNDFQHKLIFSTLLITLITLNLIILLAWFVDMRYGSGGSITSVFRYSVAIMEVAAVIAVYFISQKISFHIAGPVYAIERTLGFMNEGNLFQRLAFRKGDQFTEMADSINEVLANYQKRMINAKAILNQPGEPSREQLDALAEQLTWFVTEEEE